MTDDDAAQPREPEAAKDGEPRLSGDPGPETSSSTGTPRPDPGTGTGAGSRPADEPPTAGGTPPPWTPPAGPPPPGQSGFAGRYGLVRPLQGRYLAGVCAALGRATNTDPVLWRVLLAVLGFFGGIGIVIYVVAWLIIPSEGDTASPLEALLGRGQSSMSPVTVLLLGILVAVILGFIITDEFRALLLGAAIVVGGVLLLTRNGNPSGTAPPAGPGAPPPPPPVPPTAAPAAYPPPPPPPPAAPAPAPTPAGPPAHPAGGWPPGRTGAAPTWPMPPSGPPLWGPPVAGPPPTGAPPAGAPGGYRPPFAPHGPYAGTQPAGPPRPPQPAPRPAPPRERSRLGVATVSVILLIVGLVTALDLAGVVNVRVSTYFAAILLTIALGLLVGAWFGRARWLIPLGLVTALGLGVATVAESPRSGPIRWWARHDVAGDVLWRPSTYDELATRYQSNFGNATLDLTDVDFTDRDAYIAVEVNFGNLTVLVPPDVDVTARADVNAGSAQLFRNSDGGFGNSTEVTDLGEDGAGGGKLRLELEVNAGNVEVRR
jgi:phage shock protein PspC (stress-responsive transcriptional regulator)